MVRYVQKRIGLPPLYIRRGGVRQMLRGLYGEGPFTLTARSEGSG
jgi:hypothetical protein